MYIYMPHPSGACLITINFPRPRPACLALPCLFPGCSLNVGMQRPGLASVPTLLLALGLALAATPTSGDLMAGWGGLRASLAANFLLAVRAIAAKVQCARRLFFFFVRIIYCISVVCLPHCLPPSPILHYDYFAKRPNRGHIGRGGPQPPHLLRCLPVVYVLLSVVLLSCSIILLVSLSVSTLRGASIAIRTKKLRRVRVGAANFTSPPPLSLRGACIATRKKYTPCAGGWVQSIFDFLDFATLNLKKNSSLFFSFFFQGF